MKIKVCDMWSMSSMQIISAFLDHQTVWKDIFTWKKKKASSDKMLYRRAIFLTLNVPQYRNMTGVQGQNLAQEVKEPTEL